MKPQATDRFIPNRDVGEKSAVVPRVEKVSVIVQVQFDIGACRLDLSHHLSPHTAHCVIAVSVQLYVIPTLSAWRREPDY